MNKPQTLSEILLAMKEQEVPGVTADLVAAASQTSAKVGTFLQGKSIVGTEFDENDVLALNSNFSVEGFAGLGFDAIDELLESSDVPKEHRTVAREELAIILGQAAMHADSTSGLVNAHLRCTNPTESGLTKVVGFESIVPSDLVGDYSATTSATEHFGVKTDKLSTDVTTAITVSLMKWSGSLAPRLLPTIASANSVVSYTRYEDLVYNLNDAQNEVTTVLELARNPAPVANELEEIALLATHADITTAGVLPIDKDVNVFEASATTEGYGLATFNRTDLISDGANIVEVYFTIKYDTNAAQDYTVSIPASRGTLHRVDNNFSTVRQRVINYTVQFDSAGVDDLGAGFPAAMITYMATTNKERLLQVNFRLTATLDIVSGVASVFGPAIPAITALGGAAITDATDATAAATELAKITVAVTGAKPDFRRSQENYRTSALVADQQVSERLFEVPNGRAIAAQRSHESGVAGKERQIATLTNLGGIGRDATLLKSINGFIDNVKDETAAYAVDPINNPRPGLLYPAGGMVNPYVTDVTIDLSKVATDSSDSRLREAILARVSITMNTIMAGIMTNSLLNRQLSPGAKLVFRGYCSGALLSTVIGPGTKMCTADAGIDYACELDDGTKVEIVTTTDDSVGDELIIFPIVKGAPETPLNFAHNRNCGSVVAAFDTSDNTAEYKRMMVSTREIAIPTNVVAARILFTNIADISLEPAVTT